MRMKVPTTSNMKLGVWLLLASLFGKAFNISDILCKEQLEQVIFDVKYQAAFYF